MTHTLDGVIVFEVLPNGCLNGVYSNDHSQTENKIFNEIARKNDGIDNIVGEYVCSFIGNNNEIWGKYSKLEIKDNNPQMGKFHFIWTDQKGNIMFEGKGWLTNANQIVVWYWSIL